LREESLELLTEKESIEPQRDIGAAPMSKAHWPDGNLKHEWENKSIWKDGNKMIGLKYEWEYKDGSRYEFFEKSENLKKSRVNGLFRAYWPKSRAGGIRYEWEYEDGKRADGVSKGWWPNGQLKQYITWKNEQWHGIYTEWHEETGNKDVERHYNEGKVEGLYTRWHDSGIKSEEGNYLNGEKDEKWTEWYSNGDKNFEVFYKEGLYCHLTSNKPYTGYRVIYYENGDLSTEENYKDGVLHGVKTRWFDDNLKKNEQTWENGELISITQYEWHDKTDILREKGTFDGESDGVLHGYYKSGEKEFIKYYKEGKKHGIATFWYENGQKKEEGNFEDSVKDGLWTSWYENGQKEYERVHENEKIISEYFWVEDIKV